jgi:hypothetical protein
LPTPDQPATAAPDGPPGTEPDYSQLTKENWAALESAFESAAGGDFMQHLWQVCYWYRKVEGLPDSHPVNSRVVKCYLAAKHDLTSKQISKMTPGEIVAILRHDAEAKATTAVPSARPPTSLTEQQPPGPPQSPLSASDLARLLNLPVSKVESFLRRHREKYPDCYLETEKDGRRRNEPKYLYRPSEVWQELLKLRNPQ